MSLIRRWLRRRAYHAYLRSDGWRDIRLQALQRDRWRCRSCGSTQNLEVHHLTYVRFGHERLSDLVVLCRKCHQQTHRRK